MKLKIIHNQISEQVKNARLLRERFLADPYRPYYHFVIPEDLGIPGDPNGAFFANGRYHLMYLYHRRDSGFCWGHISSLDLVHWRHHPDAIGPEDGDDGCFSGGAFLDNDGTAYLSYWRLWKDKGIGIAKSSGPLYEKWEKFPESAIPATKFGIWETADKQGKPLILACADPSNIWKKNQTYYMQAGNLPVLNAYGRNPNLPTYTSVRGDWVDLYKSHDLHSWEYVHRFYDRDQSDKWTDATEDDMCPSFLPLPASADGGKASGKYLQLFIAHNKGCQYYIGDYDEKNDKFIPQVHGRMSWVDNTFFAPEALIDNKGRQIMWAWLLDNPENDKKAQDRGWSGVYGLPRLLWLGADGNLRMKVPPEFEMLRYNEKHWEKLHIRDRSPFLLDGINSQCCEILLTITPNNAEKIGLNIISGSETQEKTCLYYDCNEKCLIFDATKSSFKKLGRPILEKAPFDLNSDTELNLHIFIDRCVIEIFANDRQAISRRVFPTQIEERHVSLFVEKGDGVFHVVQVWELMPSNPY